MLRHIDLTGSRVGTYVVLERVANRGSRPWYRCKCDCGEVFERDGQNIRKGGAISGCRPCAIRRASMSSVTHGESNTALYRRWCAMIQRCRDPGCRTWKWYGAKGVRVCDEWQEYSHFKAWAMATGYSEKLQLDRINPEGHYEPSNCQWLTVRANVQRMAKAHGRKLKSRWHSLAFLRKKLVHYRAENMFLRKIVREELARAFATEEERAAMDAVREAAAAKHRGAIKKLFGVH